VTVAGLDAETVATAPTTAMREERIDGVFKRKEQIFLVKKRTRNKKNVKENKPTAQPPPYKE
jgi:hypothetical protein